MAALAWLATLGGVVFSCFHSDDRDALQTSSVLFTVILGFYAFIMTLYHWVVLVPMLRERDRRASMDS